MSLIIRNVTLTNLRQAIHIQSNTSVFYLSCRKLSIVPSIYDGEDPAPKFFSNNVQVLLKRITRPDFAIIFRKRTNSGANTLKTPRYKFLTNEELESEIVRANKKASKLLQMPPVVKIQEHIDEVLSRDPALIGYDTSKYTFTDISFGVSNEQRIIIERNSDGTLQACDHDIRKRLNQVYFPMEGRKIRDPVMFTDPERLNSLLEKQKYEFVLDRACIQYEPDEITYQNITSTTYQHVDMRRSYNMLRSTRHFGPMTFYLIWHQSIDNLMLELIQNNALREAVLLVALKQDVCGDITNGDVAVKLTQKILPTPVEGPKPDQLTEDDIQLDNECIECIANYISSNSTLKSPQELALQGFREYYQQQMELSRGLKKAHGKI